MSSESGFPAGMLGLFCGTLLELSPSSGSPRENAEIRGFWEREVTSQEGCQRGLRPSAATSELNFWRKWQGLD